MTLSPAQDDSPERCPRPGDPGTYTVELFDLADAPMGKAALTRGTYPDIIQCGDDRFFRAVSHGYYREVQCVRVQAHA